MKRFYLLAILAMGMMVISGCAKPELIVHEQKVDGLSVRIEVAHGTADESQIRSAIKEAVKTLKQTLKLFDSNENPLRKLENASQPVEVTDNYRDLVNALMLWQSEANGIWTPVITTGDSTTSKVDQANPSFPLITQDSTGRIGLAVPGALKLDYLRSGWAVDQAAELMKQRGIVAAKITLDRSCRYWGTPGDNQKWDVAIPAGEKDIVKYVIKPPAGGVSIVEASGGNKKWSALVAWASDALSASIVNDIAQSMSVRVALNWFSERGNIGLLVKYPEGGEVVIETDQALSTTVEEVTP